MPSFDIVSELNAHEVANAIDQANREVGTRFDFKGTNAKYELKDFVVTLTAQADFQLKQMMDILKLKLTKRSIDIVCMKIDEPIIVGRVHNGKNAHPVSLPGEKTVSLWRTRSSPGGEGFNEVRMDDKAGAELLGLHAQLDFRAEVGRDATWTVGRSRVRRA